MTDRRGFLALLALIFGWRQRPDPQPFLDYTRREVVTQASADLHKRQMAEFYDLRLTMEKHRLYDVHGTPLLEQRDPETGLTPGEAQREINQLYNRLLEDKRTW